MYYGKKKWIIISIVIIVLIIAIVGVGLFLFLKTDLFKSNKDLFYKYMGEQISAYKSNNGTQREQVENLKQVKPYTTEGELTIGYEDMNSDQNPLTESLENLLLKVNGKYDKANEVENTNITLVNGTQDVFTIGAARTGDIYALREDEIVKDVYVGIRNDNLKVLAQKLGIDSITTQFLPDTMTEALTQTDLLQFSEEDIKHIQEIYAPVLSGMIKEANYSKQNGVTISNDSQSYTCNSYRLDLSGTELKSVILAILTQLQTDSITLNLISTNAIALGLPDEYTDIEEITALIENIMDEIQELEFPEEGISMVVYESQGKAVSAELIVKYEFKITMFNDVKADSLALNIKLENLSAREGFNVITVKITVSETATQTMYAIDFNMDDILVFNVSYDSNGLATTDNVQNNFSVTVETENQTILANYSEKMEFTDSIDDMVELNSSNTAILNDYTTEQLNAIIPQISDMAIQVFTQKIMSLGIGQTNNVTPNLNEQNEGNTPNAEDTNAGTQGNVTQPAITSGQQ